jgi:hypothetical protein
MAPGNHSVGSDLRDLSVELLTTFGGLVTSLATVGLNYFLAQWLDFDFLSLSIGLIVPAGALSGGMAAASGYYVTARMTQTMPSRKVLWNMLAVGASTWALGQWIPYVTLKLDDGRALADLVPFWEYFKYSVQSTQLSFGTRGASHLATAGELGSLGYVREVLQLLGFTVGGLAVYGFLSNVEACQDCRRYAKTDTLLQAANTEDFDSLLRDAEISLPNLSVDAQAALGSHPLLGLTLWLCRCPRCAQEWVRPAVVYRSVRETTTKKLAPYFVDPGAASALRTGVAAKRPADDQAAA